MNIALILAGGRGIRLGSNIPKQYIEVNGRMIISYCLELFCEHSEIDKIQIVAEKEWQEQILKEVEKYDTKHKFCGISSPGEIRQTSILYGLSDIKKYAQDSDYVLIHDAARPLLSSEMVSDCFDAIGGHDGVIPVLAIKDMLYFSEQGRTIDSLLNRNKIYAGQAPEAFQLGKYYKATIELLPGEIFNINGSTEVAIKAGMDVVMIPGDEKNFKITTKADLERFEEILANLR